MRNQNSKARIIKRKLTKCEGVCRTYTWTLVMNWVFWSWMKPAGLKAPKRVCSSLQFLHLCVRCIGFGHSLCRYMQASAGWGKGRFKENFRICFGHGHLSVCQLLFQNSGCRVLKRRFALSSEPRLRLDPVRHHVGRSV